MVEDFVAQFEWVDFLAKTAETRSNTSVCLKFDLTPGQIKWMVKELGDRHVAYDVGGCVACDPSAARARRVHSAVSSPFANASLTLPPSRFPPACLTRC